MGKRFRKGGRESIHSRGGDGRLGDEMVADRESLWREKSIKGRGEDSFLAPRGIVRRGFRWFTAGDDSVFKTSRPAGNSIKFPGLGEKKKEF